MVNIAIVGSRDFEDYELLYNELKEFLFDIDYEGDLNGEWSEVLYSKYNSVKIISGGAKGADTLGERFAKDFNLDTLIFKPDWNMYGKSAGFIRNRKIVENCDVLFAFQVNKSRGTQHSIDLARELKKEVYVYEITQ